MLSRVNDTLKDIKRGRLRVPDDADPALFILSDGKVDKKPEVPTVRTLADLFRVYEETLPPGVKEESTRDGERIHLKHLGRHLNEKMPVRGMKPHDLQNYINRRGGDTWNGEPIKGDTIAKEVTTFRLIWNWAVRMGYINGNVPVDGLEYPKRDEREPFMTWEEIERRIARGVPDDVGTKLWEYLYLTRSQIDEVLLPGIHLSTQCSFSSPIPVPVEARFSVRKSTISNSMKGLSKSAKKLTFRPVEMSSQLSEVMKEWFDQHPGGSYTIVPRGKRRAPNEALTVCAAHDHFKRTLAGSRWDKIQGFHVFRHSFVSNAAYAGVPEAVIDAWMGHQTEEMRRRRQAPVPGAAAVGDWFSIWWEWAIIRGCGPAPVPRRKFPTPPHPTAGQTLRGVDPAGPADVALVPFFRN
ncbi:MAG: site-specific integrase [Planctomycetaceae bacterium]|nr:site-specific integrase [Planctomycetaceae bacterium]